MKIVEIWSNWFGFGSADRTCWFGRTTEPTEPASSAEPEPEPERFGRSLLLRFSVALKSANSELWSH